MIGFQDMSQEEVTRLYRREMVRDFPPPELKPLESILRMTREGIYRSLLVTQDGTPAGYALLVLPKESDAALLDYLAVFPAFRGTGVGGQLLPALARAFPQRLITLESEWPQDAPDPALAARRLAFYKRSGCLQAASHSYIFGVHYALLAVTDDPARLDRVAPAMEEFYALMVRSPQVRQNNVEILPG